MDHFRTSEITKIDVQVLDAKSKCRFTNYKSINPGGGTRGSITELSRQSRSRLLYKARNIPDLKTMLTFTYPGEEYAESATGGNYMISGPAVKEHLRKLRQALTYRGLFGFWFLEFQKRGAPHFHICVNGELTVPQVEKLRKTWYKMVGSTCEHHLERGMDYAILRKKHAAGAYAAKYSCKDEQKTVPEQYSQVGRFWGIFGKIPKDTIHLRTSMKELYQMARIARNWVKADARSKNYPNRRWLGRGLTGYSLYNCAPVLRAYLQYHYIGAENPSRIDVRAPDLHSLACESPLSERISKISGKPCLP